MSKKAYKELRKKLKNKFTGSSQYGVPSAVLDWIDQSDIDTTLEHLNIVFTIMGSVPYPHQEADRLVIINYLKEHKYGYFKNSK